MMFVGEEKRCWSERRLAQRTARRHNETRTGGGGGGGKSLAGETFIPECNEDGRFAEIQVQPIDLSVKRNNNKSKSQFNVKILVFHIKNGHNFGILRSKFDFSCQSFRFR